MVHSTSPPCNGTVSTCRIHWSVLGHWHLSNLCVFSQWTPRFPHEKLTQFSHLTKFQQTLARGLIVLRSRTIVIHFFFTCWHPSQLWAGPHCHNTLVVQQKKCSVNVVLLMFCNYTYRNEVRGVYWIHPVCLSVCLSVCLCVNLSCPPCSIYNSRWILSIFGTNDQ